MIFWGYTNLGKLLTLILDYCLAKTRIGRTQFLDGELDPESGPLITARSWSIVLLVGGE
jgi:hypothetical protein